MSVCACVQILLCRASSQLLPAPSPVPIAPLAPAVTSTVDAGARRQEPPQLSRHESTLQPQPSARRPYTPLDLRAQRRQRLFSGLRLEDVADMFPGACTSRCVCNICPLYMTVSCTLATSETSPPAQQWRRKPLLERKLKRCVVSCVAAPMTSRCGVGHV